MTGPAKPSPLTEADRAPVCGISYSWDSDDHKNWVRKLAESLQQNGVKARLDQWTVAPDQTFRTSWRR